MPRYDVAVTEIIEYVVRVTARNEEHAAELGERRITNSADRDKYCVDCRAREVEGVNLVPPAKPKRGLLRQSADL